MMFKYWKAQQPLAGNVSTAVLRRGRPDFANERAYTFAEVLIATLILALLVIGLYGAFSFGFKVIRASQETLRADQLLVEEMEALRLYDWSKITNGTFVPTNLTARYAGSGGSGIGAIYDEKIMITSAPVTQSYSNSLRQLTVTLNWASGGVTRARAMTTLISQDGLSTFRQ